MQTQGNIVPVSSAKGIDAAKIEKELASIWSGEAASGSAPDVTRASALNLVVYATPQEDRARLDEMLNEVVEQHPGRVLILFADREAKATKLEAYVSARCRELGQRTKQICSEQVVIEACGPSIETAASAVAPLLVSDVPVFLWWKDIPHFKDSLFDHLATMADRLVIDSAAFDNPHADMLRLAEMIRERQTERVSDINWGRLTSWRMLLASFWDAVNYRPYLDAIDSVVIEYDPPDVAPDEIAPKALLTMGWLASRLGWKLKPAGARKEFDTTHLAFTSGERNMSVRLQASEETKAADGMLSSITLSSADGKADFYVSLKDDGAKLETWAKIEDRRTVSRLLAYESKTEAQRLSRELGFLARDSIYEAALAVAAEVIQDITKG